MINILVLRVINVCSDVKLPILTCDHFPASQLLRFIDFLNGFLHYWDAETGENDCFAGKGHTNQVTKMALNDIDELVTCSMDDTVRYTNVCKKEYRYFKVLLC